MRSVFGLVGLLVATAIVLLLFARSARQSMRVATVPIPALREGVAARPFDRTAAAALLTRLEALIDEDRLPTDELVAAREQSAGWAAASQPGTGEYRCALKMREAADALLAAARGEQARRADARRALHEARAALASPAALPGGAAGAIRDQLENLQQSQRERIEDADHQAP